MEVRKKISEFTTRWLEKVKPYFEEKQPEATTHRCCISIANFEVTIIHINKTEEVTEILLTETLRFDHIDNLLLLLTGLVTKHQLTDMPLYWLLSLDDYQFFLIESLPVPTEEFRDALNWRIKGLLPYPVEEAAIDYFTLPVKKVSASNPMIAIATAKKAFLKQYMEIFKICGLRLTTIDIPELALRNLSAIYETDEKNTAFLYFHNNIVLLNITSKKQLYFSRHIAFAAETESAPRNYEQISLEIMRYLDYFQSQWRRSIPSRIFVASEQENAKEIADMLSKQLLINVEPYALKSVLMDKEKMHSLEKKFLLTFGCALREDTTSD